MWLHVTFSFSLLKKLLKIALKQQKKTNFSTSLKATIVSTLSPPASVISSSPTLSLSLHTASSFLILFFPFASKGTQLTVFDSENFSKREKNYSHFLFSLVHERLCALENQVKNKEYFVEFLENWELKKKESCLNEKTKS